MRGMKISAIEGTLKKGALEKAWMEIELYRRRCAMKWGRRRCVVERKAFSLSAKCAKLCLPH